MIPGIISDAKPLGTIVGRARARPGRLRRARLLVAALAIVFWPPAPSRADAPDASIAPASDRSLILESIEIDGNVRTQRETVLLYLPLRSGDRLDARSLSDAIDALRRSDLFADVEYSVRRGTARGHVVLELAVDEKRAQLRFGSGYSDLSGWYLIPAELRLDNRLGRGERLRLHVKVGYRVSGLELAFDEPRFGDGRNRWGFGLSAASTDRVYFIDGVEYRHRVGRGAAEVRIARKTSPRWEWEIGSRVEGVDADSFATVHATSDARGVERGDELERGELPATIARDIGEEARSVAHLGVAFDSRGPDAMAGSPGSGLWGRVRAEEVLRGEGRSFAAVTVDGRAYRAIGALSLAARARGGVVGGAAPFYDRFYIGGLYTVRGFPSQSLSAPEGETRFWSASVELRAPLVGRRPTPRLAGILFVDAGDSWGPSSPRLRDVAAGAGFGVRLRAPWVGWLGLDLGIPLSPSPVDESYHANASIGWTY